MFLPGGYEWIVVVVVGLIAFGPKRLPEIARMMGKMTRAIQQATREVKQQIDLASLEAPPPRRPTQSYSSESEPPLSVSSTDPTPPTGTSTGEGSDDIYDTYTEDDYSYNGYSESTGGGTSTGGSDTAEAPSGDSPQEKETELAEPGSGAAPEPGDDREPGKPEGIATDEESPADEKPVTPSSTNLSDDYVSD